MRKLEIDPEFRDLLPALSEDEFKRLEESVIDYGGCHSPILVWGNTIIDGHNRWKILQEHPELTNYKIQQMNYIDRHEAIYWILQNQLGRRNLDGIAYDLAVAKAYEEQMQVQGGNSRSQKVHKNTSYFFDNKKTGKTINPTAIKVASDFGVSSNYVQKAHALRQGLDAAEEVAPGFKDEVISGEVRASKKLLRELRKVPKNSRKKAVDAIRIHDTYTAKKEAGIPVKENASGKNTKAIDLTSNVRRAIDSLESAKPNELLAIKSEVPAMVYDFISKIDRMYELHKDAIQTAEGKAVMIENLTKVKNAIDERMKDYEG